MGSRLRWDAALYHRPGLQPPDKRGRKPAKGQCQRRLQGWAERADTPRVPPVEIRFGLVADPEGKLRMEAFFCTDPQTTPVQILAWVVMRGSVEVTCEEARAHLGLETQRQWSDLAMARTTPVLLAVFSLVTVLALQVSQGGQIPVPATAWSHKTEPTFADCVVVVRQHLWRARSLVNSAPEPEFVPCPREAFELLLTSLPLAA
jgi:hypothetical protein